MAKNIIIFLICLLIPSFAFGGTWSHRIVKTKTDGSVIVAFTRSPTGEVTDVTFSRFIDKGDEQIKRKKENLEAGYQQAIYEEQFPSTFSRNEVENILKEKGYIVEGEKLEDLKSKAVEAKGVKDVP